MFFFPNSFEWNVQTLAIQRVLPNCASLFATFLLSHPSDWSLSYSTCWSSRQLATPVSESTVDVHNRISVYICINKNYIYIYIYVAAVEQHDLNKSEHVSNVPLPNMLTYEFSERKGLPLARAETAPDKLCIEILRASMLSIPESFLTKGQKPSHCDIRLFLKIIHSTEKYSP